MPIKLLLRWVSGTARIWYTNGIVVRELPNKEIGTKLHWFQGSEFVFISPRNKPFTYRWLSKRLGGCPTTTHPTPATPHTTVVGGQTDPTPV